MAITTNVTSATRQITSYTNNGFTTDTVGGVSFPLQQGVPYQNLYTFKVIPAAASNTCVAPAQSWPGSGVPYTLNTANTVSGTQIISEYVYYNGQTGIKLDCERGISVTLGGTSTETTFITMTGYDYRGVAIELEFGLGTAGAGTYNTAQQMSIITSITASANPGVTLSFGNAGTEFTDYGTISLPYYLPRLQYVASCSWDGSAIAIESANITVGNNWRTTPPVTLTTATGPARGLVILPSAPDGTKIFTITYFVYGSDSEMNSELINGIQSTRNIVQVQEDTSGFYIWPYLTQYDLVGMQYAGDLVAAEAYKALIDA